MYLRNINETLLNNTFNPSYSNSIHNCNNCIIEIVLISLI